MNFTKHWAARFNSAFPLNSQVGLLLNVFSGREMEKKSHLRQSYFSHRKKVRSYLSTEGFFLNFLRHAFSNVFNLHVEKVSGGLLLLGIQFRCKNASFHRLSRTDRKYCIPTLFMLRFSFSQIRFHE